MSEPNTQTDDQLAQANATQPGTRRRNRLTRGLVAMAAIVFVAIGIGAASNRDSPANTAAIADSPSGPRVLLVDTISIEHVVSYQVVFGTTLLALVFVPAAFLVVGSRSAAVVDATDQITRLGGETPAGRSSHPIPEPATA
ncbi:MAG: hypothetical protein ABGZ53_24855 [Fuerstiella sp.]